jgi:hypothetical protein
MTIPAKTKQTIARKHGFCSNHPNRKTHFLSKNKRVCGVKHAFSCRVCGVVKSNAKARISLPKARSTTNR